MGGLRQASGCVSRGNVNEGQVCPWPSEFEGTRGDKHGKVGTPSDQQRPEALRRRGVLTVRGTTIILIERRYLYTADVLSKHCNLIRGLVPMNLLA